MVSSLYGHGEIDCRGFKEKCIEAGLDKVLLYVGGNIVVGEQDFLMLKKGSKDGVWPCLSTRFTIDKVLPFIEEDLGPIDE